MSGSAIDFRSVPEIGTVVMLDTQSYRLIGTEPYTRKDGTPSNLLTWMTDCPDCGDEFTVQSGLVCKAMNRRCETHRHALKPVKRGRKPIKVRVIKPSQEPAE